MTRGMMWGRFLAVLATLLALALSGNATEDIATIYSAVDFESRIVNLEWIGEDDMVVFATTEAGHLWRSDSGGAEWSDETAANKLVGALESSTQQFPDGMQVSTAQKGVAQVIWSPIKPEWIFFRGYGSLHWSTQDRGKTYKQVKGPAGTIGHQTIRLHPTIPGRILTSVRRWACYLTDFLTNPLCADDLFYSDDFGVSWTNMTANAQGRILNFVDFDWGFSKDAAERNAHARADEQYNADTILATVVESSATLDPHKRRTVVGWDRQVNFVRSSDFFKSKHALEMKGGNQFEIVGSKLFLAVAQGAGTARDAFAVNLHVSHDSGRNFEQVCFPVPLAQRGYSLVSVESTGAVYINVDHDAEDGRRGPFGNVYSSDSRGLLFSLSLRRNARTTSSAIDFDTVHGLPGVIIANQVGDDLAFDSEDMDDLKVTTRISFSGGAQWEPLNPPAVDAEERPITCSRGSPECQLHLHGPTSWRGLGLKPPFASFYSHENAPGIVLATGNMGRYLYEEGDVNTYLTRDGGMTWEEIRKGPFIFEIGDQGGVILMAPMYELTTKLIYTLDEGLTWVDLTFSEEPVFVHNIRVEPDSAGRVFLVQALEKANVPNDSRRGRIIAVDFARDQVGFPPCRESDYEDWSPTTTHCLLGRNFTLQRQKRESKCYNGKAYVRPNLTALSSQCECTAADYECDFGSEHKGAISYCQPIGLPYSCPVVDEGRYKIGEKRKRLVAGDVCVGKVTGYGHYVDHPTAGASGGHFWLGSFLITLVILAGIMALYMVQTGRWEMPSLGAIFDRLPSWSNVRDIQFQNLRARFPSLTGDRGGGGADQDFFRVPPEDSPPRAMNFNTARGLGYP